MTTIASSWYTTRGFSTLGADAGAGATTSILIPAESGRDGLTGARPSTITAPSSTIRRARARGSCSADAR